MMRRTGLFPFLDAAMPIPPGRVSRTVDRLGQPVMLRES
jgi:hypothetical protein